VECGELRDNMRLNIRRIASVKFKSIVILVATFTLILGSVGFVVPRFFDQVAHAVTPTINCTVSGFVGATGLAVSGNTTGNTCNTTISGILTEYSNPGQRVSFAGTLSGDINGSMTGGVNYNGADTLFAEITGTGAVGYVYLTGIFSGEDGNFIGNIFTQVNPINFTTAINITGGNTVSVGSTLQLSATTNGDNQTVAWAVYVNDSAKANINQTTGLLTATGVGSVTVIASSLDGSLVTKNYIVNVTEPVYDVATVTSTVYTVSANGSANETITNIPLGTSKATFLANIVSSEPHANWNTLGINSPVVNGDTLVVTSGNGLVTVTYNIYPDNIAPVITLNDGLSSVDVVYGSTFTDTGAHTDDGSSVTISGDTVTSSSPVGSYHITYDSVDSRVIMQIRL